MVMFVRISADYYWPDQYTVASQIKYYISYYISIILQFKITHTHTFAHSLQENNK